MERGGYNGGSTVLRPGSDRFSKPKKQKKLTEAEQKQREFHKAKKKERTKAKQVQDQQRA